MITFGQLRLEALKLPHGAGTDKVTLNRLINTRRREILDQMGFTRREKTDNIITVAEYNTGTVEFTQGSDTITGTGTTWTSAMTGRRIRKFGENSYYTFTYVSGTEGTLDRVYEGDTDSEASYSLTLSNYALPSDLDVLWSIKNIHTGTDMGEISRELLDQKDPSRLLVGEPCEWSHFDEDSNGLPQVELYPTPQYARQLPIRYKFKDELAASSDALQGFESPGAILAGVEADLYALAGQPAMFQLKEARFRSLVSDLVRVETSRTAPQQLQMDSAYIRHRRGRAGADDYGDMRSLFNR